MGLTSDKSLLFQSHQCSSGLCVDALREISDAAELMKYSPGDYLHQANEPVESLFLIVHGRLKQAVVDMHGETILHRFLLRGDQFGALGAAQAVPVPVDVLALEPSAALRLDFATALRFTQKHEAFGINLTRTIASMVQQLFLPDRRPPNSPLVSIFRESPSNHTLTTRLIRRLRELGETIGLMSDIAEFEPVDGVLVRSLFDDDGNLISRDEIRRQLIAWSKLDRVFILVTRSMAANDASSVIELSEQVIWCIAPEQIQSTIKRLAELESRVSAWRDKINLVWLLDGGTPVAPRVDELTKLVDRDFKISLAEPPLNRGPPNC
jgi:CRP-like cAMP-binding protein